MEYTQSSRNKHIGANALCLALLRHVDGTYACIYMRAILNFRGRFDSPASGEKVPKKVILLKSTEESIQKCTQKVLKLKRTKKALYKLLKMANSLKK